MVPCVPSGDRGNWARESILVLDNSARYSTVSKEKKHVECVSKWCHLFYAQTYGPTQSESLKIQAVFFFLRIWSPKAGHGPRRSLRKPWKLGT